MTITVFLMKQNSKIIEIINHSNSAHHHHPIHHHYSDHHQEECVHGGKTFPQTDNYYYHRGNNYHHSHHPQHHHQNRKSPKQPNNTVHPFLFLFIAKSIMTGDKVEVHNEPSSILSEGQRDDSNGTAQSHSQQSTQPNTNNDNTNTNTNTNNNSHNCKNNWWNCCCCCCSCISIKHQTEKNVENKVQLSSIENYFNDDDEPPPNLEEIRSWAESFDKMMKCKYGRKVFRDFLRCEYSEENIMFWLACEDLKKECNPDMIEEKARLIYEDFISILSPREVSLDSRVREIINKNMIEPTPNTFDEAQIQIYTLMHRDSFPRFINSSAYRQLAQLPTTSRKTSSTS